MLCGPGTLFLTMQATIQDYSRAHQDTPMPIVTRHESALELNIYYAHTRWVLMPSKWVISIWYLILIILQAIDEFICELQLKETNMEKWCKIAALALDEEEWTCMHLFSNILQVCNITC